MNWENLSSGRCPKDDEELYQDKFDFLKCGYCTFKIGLGKFTDLTKGKKSTKYKAATKRNKFIHKYKTNIKKSMDKAIDKQREERESNLRRMNAKKSD